MELVLLIPLLVTLLASVAAIAGERRPIDAGAPTRSVRRRVGPRAPRSWQASPLALLATPPIDSRTAREV